LKTIKRKRIAVCFSQVGIGVPQKCLTIEPYVVPLSTLAPSKVVAYKESRMLSGAIVTHGRRYILRWQLWTAFGCL